MALKKAQAASQASQKNLVEKCATARGRGRYCGEGEASKHAASLKAKFAKERDDLSQRLQEAVEAVEAQALVHAERESAAAPLAKRRADAALAAQTAASAERHR